MSAHPHEEITFRSRGRSRREWKARFECGERNGALILDYAWKHNAEIVKASTYEEVPMSLL